MDSTFVSLLVLVVIILGLEIVNLYWTSDTHYLARMLNRELKDLKNQLDVSCEPSSYLVACVCTSTAGEKVYRTFTSGDKIAVPSKSDLSNLRENVLSANPDFKDCVIIGFWKIKDDA